MSKSLWQGTKHFAPGETHVRARRIVRHTGGIIRGKFPSRKNQRMVHYEGLLERDAISLFECSPRIARFREQPLTISYPDGARRRRYTPDFELVLLSGEVMLIEVKPSRALEDKDTRHKLECVNAYLSSNHLHFVVLTEQVIRQQPRLSNLDWIYQRLPQTVPTELLLTTCLERYAGEFPTSIKRAIEILSGSGGDPFSGLWVGHLQADFDSPMNLNSIVQIVKDEHHDWFRISKEHDF